MNPQLTSEVLATIETAALDMLRSPGASNGLKAAIKRFIPTAARLRSQLLIAESADALQEAVRPQLFK